MCYVASRMLRKTYLLCRQQVMKTIVKQFFVQFVLTTEQTVED